MQLYTNRKSLIDNLTSRKRSGLYQTRLLFKKDLCALLKVNVNNKRCRNGLGIDVFIVIIEVDPMVADNN